ncbi:MAG: hypothetical protein ABR596_00515 [Halarsenatibacteraceae bacterium]
MIRSNKLVVCIFIGLILFSLPIAAEEQPYIIDADTITYDYNLQELTASGNVFFRVPGLEVIADDIVVYIVKDEIRGTGDIKLQTESETMIGEELYYNYNTGEGEILAAESEIDDLNFSGGKITIVSEMEHAIEIKEAILTPCIKPDPHYRLEAATIKIYPGDRAVAEDVSFYWGDSKIFTIGNYVLHYEQDEETGEERLSRPVPTYQIGYDTLEGLYLELEYGYEIFDRTSGGFYFTNTQRGRQQIRATNYFSLADNLKLDTRYSREEIDDPEEDKLEYEEIFETILTYEPADYFDLDAGFRYHDEESEILETYFAGWNHHLTDNFTITGRQSRKLEYFEGARDEAEITKPLELSFDYNPSPFRFKYDYSFDFITDNFRQEYLINNTLKDEIDISFYHDYRNGELDRQSYQLTGNNYLSWRIRYRSGYDLEYLPYLDISKGLPYGFDLSAGMGRLNEKGKDTGQIEIKPGWSSSIKIANGWNVEARGNYNWHYYLNGSEQIFYANMETELGISFEHETESGYKFGGGIHQEKLWVSGEPFLERDKKTEKNSYLLDLNLRIPTEEPQSSLDLEFSGKYQKHKNEWRDIELGLMRKLDCYSYGFKAEFLNDEPAISFSFDLAL